MKTLWQGLIMLLSSTALATSTVYAASTDYSGQWWVPAESGWGAAVLQQANTLFVDLMVYGTDGKPTWFTVAASTQASPPQGHTVFAGDLYATTGPYYGGTFSPSSVTSRKVGTLTFDANTLNDATISYTVDGTPVLRNVTRQTWSYENLSGTYDAVWRDGCLSGDWHDGPLDGFSSTVIQHASDNAVTITVTYLFYLSDDRTDVRGTYSQSGHLGQIAGELGAPNSGSILISEIAKTATGFTARFTRGTCSVAGWVVAVPTSF